MDHTTLAKPHVKTSENSRKFWEDSYRQTYLLLALLRFYEMSPLCLINRASFWNYNGDPCEQGELCCIPFT